MLFFSTGICTLHLSNKSSSNALMNLNSNELRLYIHVFTTRHRFSSHIMESLPAWLMYMLNEGSTFNTHWIPLKYNKRHFDVQSWGLLKVFLHRDSRFTINGQLLGHGWLTSGWLFKRQLCLHYTEHLIPRTDWQCKNMW